MKIKKNNLKKSLVIAFTLIAIFLTILVLAANIIQNPGFETDTIWIVVQDTAHGAFAVVQTANTSHSGNYSGYTSTYKIPGTIGGDGDISIEADLYQNFDNETQFSELGTLIFWKNVCQYADNGGCAYQVLIGSTQGNLLVYKWIIDERCVGENSSATGGYGGIDGITMGGGGRGEAETPNSSGICDNWTQQILNVGSDWVNANFSASDNITQIWLVALGKYDYDELHPEFSIALGQEVYWDDFLMNTSALNVILNAPPNGTITNTTTWNFNCTSYDSGNALENVTIYIWNSTKGNIYYQNTKNISGGSNFTNWEVNFVNESDNIYRWNCKAKTTGGLEKSYDYNWSIVIDTTPPEIYYNDGTTSSGTQTSRTIFINVTANDTYIQGQSFLDKVNLSWNSALEDFDNNLNDIYWETKSSLSDGTYNFYGYAIDLAGNVNITETRTVIISNPVTPSDSSPGGGGGGGAGIKKAKLSIEPSQIIIIGFPGQIIQKKITIKNSGNEGASVFLSSGGGFISFSESSFSLGAGEEKEITITIESPRERGNYLSSIYVDGGESKVIALFNLEVSESTFLDIMVTIDEKYKEISNNEKGKANIHLFYSENIPIKPIISYGIEKDKKILWESKESVEIDKEKTLIKEFRAPKELGTYYFYAKLSYGDITLKSKDSFKVISKESLLKRIFNLLREFAKKYWWLLLILLLIILAVIYYLIRKKEKQEARLVRVRDLVSQGMRATRKKKTKLAIRKYKEAVSLMNKLNPQDKALAYNKVMGLYGKLRR